MTLGLNNVLSLLRYCINTNSPRRCFESGVQCLLNAACQNASLRCCEKLIRDYLIDGFLLFRRIAFRVFGETLSIANRLRIF